MWSRYSRISFVAAVGFAAGWLVHAAAPTPPSVAAGPAKHAGPPAFPMSARLGANVWQQSSAEYAACCITIFNSAAQRLEERVKAEPMRHRNQAVVMDLDETVFDNGAFQTFLYRNNLEYSDDLWLEYEEKHPEDVRLVPGAADFIATANRLRVRVIFVSNRSHKFREVTQASLMRLLPTLYRGYRDQPEALPRHMDNTLYLKKDHSEKATRREEIAAKYTVLMVFGDNLRDFSESFAVLEAPEDLTAAIAARKQQAEQAGHRWGVDWFMLPNAVYGEWDKLLGPDPVDALHPTSMKR